MQGCPSSGSVWALLFDLAVHVLRLSLAGPRDELSVFADDIALTLAEVVAHLLALLRVFAALIVAAGLELNYSKMVVVNCAVGGVAQLVVARSAAPRLRIYWGAAVSKYNHRCAMSRSSPASLRLRLCRLQAVCRGRSPLLGAIRRDPGECEPD